MTTRHRYEILDGMRGLAALTVLFYHFTQYSDGVTLFASAPLAVDLFFCLSGFVIAHAYQERILAGLSLWGFLRLRLIRLYPAYLLGCGLGAVALSGFMLTGRADFSATQMLTASALNLLYLPYLGTHSLTLFTHEIPQDIFPLNDPGWSLFFEFAANILFFFLLRRSRLPFAVWPIFFVILFFLAVKIQGESPGWGAANFWGGFPRAGFTFFTGALLYHERARLDFLPRLPAGLLMVALAAAFAAPLFRLHTYYWFLMTIFFVPLMVALGARGTLAPGGRGQRWASHCGALSYPLYCLHFPLLMLLSLAFTAPPLWALISGMAGTILLAALAVRLEKPLGQALSRLLPP